MELTINPEWCKDFCPELAVYNKVFIKRSGKGLFSHIVFTGPDECVSAVIEKEKELFNKNNISVYMAVNEDAMSEVKGEVVIHEHSCSHARSNYFDVSGYKNFIVDDLFKRFDLDFSQVDKDKLFKKYKLNDLDHLDQDKLINNVLLNHYAHFDDDVLREADFAWIKDKTGVHAKNSPSVDDFEDMVNGEQEKDTVAVKEPEKDATVVKVSEDDTTVKEPEKDNVTVTEPEKGTTTAKEPEKHSPAVKESENTTAAKKPEKNSPAVAEPEQEVTEPDEEEENTVPKPTVPIAKKNDGYKIKDSLTEEEAARNAELLSGLVVEYKNTIDYITELKNARWNIMLNKMKDCVKNSTFNQQWCILYLNMSDDTANELYSRLYELDEKTKKFHKEIIHQVEHLHCPICEKDSDEDITFLSKGLHFIECPHCYAKRPIEKK